MTLRITKRSITASNTVTLRLDKSNDTPTYKAGQHGLFVFDINGKRETRTYSFHTSPHVDSDLAITVRAIDEGVVSNYLLTNVVETIQLEAIRGEFFIEPQPGAKRHLVMFAGGSGITPLMAMMRSILHKEAGSLISLVYANQTHERIIFRDELDALQQEFPDTLNVHHVLSRDAAIPSDFPVFFKGRLSKLIVKKIVKSLIAKTALPSEFYLCGPYLFMQLIEDTLQSLSVETSKIFREHFHIPDQAGTFDISTLVPREVIIRIKNEERLLRVDAGKSILQAALGNNLHLAHSCTEGQCGVCRSYLLSGEVKMRKNHVLDEEALSKGQILLCQAFPVSDNILIQPVN